MSDSQHLRRIHICNFKGLQDLEIEDIGAFNILLGANNVGKTSVLEAIFSANTFADLRAFVSLQNTRNYVVESFEDLTYFFYNLDISSDIIINITLNSEQERCFEVFAPTSERIAENLIQTPGDRNIETRLHQANQAAPRSISYRMNIGRKFSSKSTTFEGTMRIFSREKFDQGEIPNDALHETIATNLVLPRLGYNVQDISQLLVDKKGNEIVNILRFVDPKVQQLAAGPRSIHLDVGLKSMIPLEMFGSGLIRATNIISNCVGKSNKVELIDELEYGLHHGVIGEVLKAILTLSSRNNIQVFCTTHSIDVLKILKLILSSEEFIEFRPHVNCYVLARDKNEVVRSYRYGYEQFDHCIEHGIEIR